MRALAINGSPRRGGNTQRLLETVLAPLAAAGWETELVQLGGKEIQPCRACYRCRERQTPECSFSGDLFNGLFSKMLAADALILGSPVYFADITPEMKALIDRAGFVALAGGARFAGKIGAGVVAVRRGGAIHAVDSLNHLFLINRMIIPGSSYWNMGHGGAPGEVEQDAEGLRNMDHLGRAIAWLGAALDTQSEAYPAR